MGRWRSARWAGKQVLVMYWTKIEKIFLEIFVIHGYQGKSLPKSKKSARVVREKQPQDEEERFVAPRGEPLQEQDC